MDPDFEYIKILERNVKILFAYYSIPGTILYTSCSLVFLSCPHSASLT